MIVIHFYLINTKDSQRFYLSDQITMLTSFSDFFKNILKNLFLLQLLNLKIFFIVS